MKIIKIPDDFEKNRFIGFPIDNAIHAEELVDNTFGEGMFFKQTWDSNIHQWLLFYMDPMSHIDRLGGYCSAQINREKSVGILKTSVVTLQRAGFGDAMVKHRVKWLQEEGVKTIRSYAWFVDGAVPAQKMLMNNGFKPIDDVRGYWSKNHNKAFPCKICGENCKCVARIFEREA